MAIDPVPSSSIPDPGLKRADLPPRAEALGAARPSVGEPDVEAGTDSVELSAEALRLAAGADIPSGSLSAERLAAITRRLGDGSYDSPAAQDAVARALMNELGG